MGSAIANIIRHHHLTSREIHELCYDLKVLRRREFKQLLKWRLLIRTEIINNNKPRKLLNIKETREIETNHQKEIVSEISCMERKIYEAPKRRQRLRRRKHTASLNPTIKEKS